ncbi:MAG: cryptochrome/photolyase family protein, partial [Pseudomonadales bacterium]|nr:cryptochrome/photolyase family protein [Pseudomonadales bacterium]
MKSQYRRLCWLLGDQLNIQHSWFSTVSADTLFVLAELPQEVEYCRHHHQKITAFFAAMQRFSEQLLEQGHDCLYLDLDSTAEMPKSLPALIEQLAEQYQVSEVCYQQPDEYRLSEQLRQWQSASNIDIQRVDSEHFLLAHDEIFTAFKPNTAMRMEAFYRRMRKRFQILMQDDQPLGGQWNYDQANRQSFKAHDLETIPEPLVFSQCSQAIAERIERHNVNTIGDAAETNRWPVDRPQALQLLAYFCTALLPQFGRFQDAMTQQSPHAWSLYHSRLSFALNTKMLSPQEVIDAAVDAYENNASIDLAQVEGFVRQILGWREYMRGMYWINMPDYANRNALQAKQELPSWFWTGETRMQCLQQAIKQSLQFAYAHHIQRLMITGNFALLAGIDPDQVDAWYLGIYIDAIEWVEMPNTR